MVYIILDILWTKILKLFHLWEIGEECDECLLEDLVNIYDIDKVKEAICSLSINNKSYSDILLDSIMVILY